MNRSSGSGSHSLKETTQWLKNGRLDEKRHVVYNSRETKRIRKVIQREIERTRIKE